MKLKLLLVGIFLFLGVCSILHYRSNPSPNNYSKNRGLAWEQYDSSYFTKFQDVNSIIKAADEQPSLQKNSKAYYEVVAGIIRKRFYHGYSHYSFAANPLANLSGKVWSHLSAIVVPDDILKHPMAACSQQSIVLMEIFKRQGIDYRKISFTGHFALEGKIEGKWLYFDTNIEPNFQNKRQSLHDLIQARRFDSVYSIAKMDKTTFDKVLSNPSYGEINASAAPNAIFFQRFCKLLVSQSFLLTVFLTSLFSTLLLNRRAKKLAVQKSIRRRHILEKEKSLELEEV